MVKINEIMTYPNSKYFNDLLNYQWSMTKELIKLHDNFSVELISSGLHDDMFIRKTFLKLDNIRVIAALSSTMTTNLFFLDLLMNARENPIGEVIFAATSKIVRKNMVIQLISQPTNNKLANSIKSLNYHPQQKLWCRTSVFTYNQEQLNLTEILLPELGMFMK